MTDQEADRPRAKSGPGAETRRYLDGVDQLSATLSLDDPSQLFNPTWRAREPEDGEETLVLGEPVSAQETKLVQIGHEQAAVRMAVETVAPGTTDDADDLTQRAANETGECNQVPGPSGEPTRKIKDETRFMPPPPSAVDSEHHEGSLDSGESPDFRVGGPEGSPASDTRLRELVTSGAAGVAVEAYTPHLAAHVDEVEKKKATGKKRGPGARTREIQTLKDIRAIRIKKMGHALVRLNATHLTDSLDLKARRFRGINRIINALEELIHPAFLIPGTEHHLLAHIIRRGAEKMDRGQREGTMTIVEAIRDFTRECESLMNILADDAEGQKLQFIKGKRLPTEADRIAIGELLAGVKLDDITITYTKTVSEMLSGSSEAAQGLLQMELQTFAADPDKFYVIDEILKPENREALGLEDVFIGLKNRLDVLVQAHNQPDSGCGTIHYFEAALPTISEGEMVEIAGALAKEIPGCLLFAQGNKIWIATNRPDLESSPQYRILID
ncbi:MAG: hypothetical protein Q8P95_05715, partial [bacterium]|nr:hypothetical protein [bacterium]